MTSPVRDALLQAGLLNRIDNLTREVNGLAEDFERVRGMYDTLISSIENHIVGATRRLRLLREYVEGREEGDPPIPPPP